MIRYNQIWALSKRFRVRLDVFSFRSDLSRFEYLTMTIKESLRLHNVVPVIGRTLEEPLTISSELQSSETTLPSNLNVLLPLGLQTRNPSLWENSEVINWLFQCRFMLFFDRYLYFESDVNFYVCLFVFMISLVIRNLFRRDLVKKLLVRGRPMHSSPSLPDQGKKKWIKPKPKLLPANV